MDQMERIIQLVTDQVLQKLESHSSKPSFSFLGEPKEYIIRYYQEKGFQYVASCGIESPQILIVTELPLYRMTRLAHFTPLDDSEKGLLNRLMDQKSLVVLEDGIEYTQKKKDIPEKIRTPFEKARLELKKLGVQFMDQTEFHKTGVQQNTPTVSAGAKKKELVTMQKLQKSGLSDGDTFIVTPNMIITALAKDYIHDRHIQVDERDA